MTILGVMANSESVTSVAVLGMAEAASAVDVSTALPCTFWLVPLPRWFEATMRAPKENMRARTEKMAVPRRATLISVTWPAGADGCGASMVPP